MPDEELEQQQLADHQIAQDILDAKRPEDVPQAPQEAQQEKPAEAAPVAPAEPPKGIKEYVEEREARQKAEAELAQWHAWKAEQDRRAKEQEVAPPKADPYLQPGEYINEAMQQREAMLRAQFEQQFRQRIEPVAQTVQILAARAEFAEARAQHGDELAERAYKEFDKALPQLPQHEALQVMQAPNRFAAAVTWMKRRDMLAALGDDPTQYEQRMRERLLADPEFRRQVMSQGRSEPPPEFNASPPRDEAGRFVPRQQQQPEALPSVNRSGSAKSATHEGFNSYGSQSDMDLVEEILNAPEPSRR